MSGTLGRTWWSVAEVCASLEYTPRHLRRLRASGAFPEPYCVVNGGRTPIWDAAVVRAWAIDTGRRAASERVQTALRVYRQKGTVRAAAIAAGAKVDTVRAWFREIGEPLPSERRRASADPS